MAPKGGRPKQAAPASSRGTRFLAAGAVVVAGVVAWLAWGRGPDHAHEAELLQRQLLTMTASAGEARASLTTIMRHVDKLDLEAQRRLRDTVRDEWRRLQQEDMDAYFAAADTDRDATLDKALDRLQLIGQLNEAFAPDGMRARSQRSKEPKRTAGDRPKTAPLSDDQKIAAADRRKAIELYATALEKRANERGIDFTPYRRRLLRG